MVASLVALLALGFNGHAARIAVLPLGAFPAAKAHDVARALESKLNVEATVLRAGRPPQEAYSPARKRYRADTLLKFLSRSKPRDFDRIIGLASVDISTTKGKVKDWGIFGLGYLGGLACVVSTHRLGRRTSGVGADERLRRVSIHEVGHTFGLDHCPTPKCIMADAMGSIRSVDAGTGFCAHCRKKLPSGLAR